MASKLINIWVYFRNKHGQEKSPDKKKNRTRSKVSLRIPIERRDRRKTQTSTFVNFIHQKDAGIAMSTVTRFISQCPAAPIYTVHENFLTTLPYAHFLSIKYLEVYIDAINHEGCPLSVLNSFLFENLFPDYRPQKMYKPISIHDLRNALYTFIPARICQSQKESQSILKERNTWHSKIERILYNSQYYLRNTCSISNPNDLFPYRMKFALFRRKMEDYQNSYTMNYSLHI